MDPDVEPPVESRLTELSGVEALRCCGEDVAVYAPADDTLLGVGGFEEEEDSADADTLGVLIPASLLRRRSLLRGV